MSTFYYFTLSLICLSSFCWNRPSYATDYIESSESQKLDKDTSEGDIYNNQFKIKSNSTFNGTLKGQEIFEGKLKENNRLIIAYKLEGCEQMSEDVRSVGGVGGDIMKGQMNMPIIKGKEARDLTIRQLMRKSEDFLIGLSFNESIEAKIDDSKSLGNLANQGLGIKSFSVVNNQPNYDKSDYLNSKSDKSLVKEVVSHDAQNRVKKPIFVSRYLEGLQMEVITELPLGMSDLELKSLAETLPCVYDVFLDEDKYGKESFKYDGDNLSEKMTIDGSNLIKDLELSIENFRTDHNNFSNSKEVNPNDPLFKQQWSISKNEFWSMNAESLWNFWTGDENPIVVAIIDSGCNISHPEIHQNLWVNKNEICGDGIDNDNNGFIDDCHGWDFVDDTHTITVSESGHGTAAASIIGAAANNYLGITGVCWGCKIMCLKFIGEGQGTVSNQVQAINYAVKMGARISNNSYGGYGYARLEFEAIKRAQLAGHLFVTSAGNNNLNTDYPKNDHTPSSYPLSNIIAVGASSITGSKATFSNFGKKSVHMFAPGANILALASHGGYERMSGTSFACPHVTGAAALIWSAFPELEFHELKEILVRGCQNNRELSGYSQCGGVINVFQSAYIAAKSKSMGSSGQK